MSLSVTHRVKHVPKHRQAPAASPLSAQTVSRTAARTVLVLSSVAVAGTGVAVAAGGLVLSPGTGASAVAASVTSEATPDTTNRPEPTAVGAADVPAAPIVTSPAEDLDRRVVPVSRSDRRGVADPVKAAALALTEQNLMDRSEDSSDEDPRTIASALLSDYGFSSDQMGCLDRLWTKESGWSVTADNPTSSAYGIPQSLPGSKMASEGADWATNPVTQIRWGLGYIEDRYGSPCGAWAHSVSNNWY